MPTERQEQLVSEMLQFQNEDALAKRLAKIFDFDRDYSAVYFWVYKQQNG
ncbi:MAG: hypothetical protein ACRC46_00220 [Thermoguttaceae bacterium]